MCEVAVAAAAAARGRQWAMQSLPTPTPSQGQGEWKEKVARPISQRQQKSYPSAKMMPDVVRGEGVQQQN